MSDTNFVVLIGNVAGDPEVRYTQSGKSVCNFTIATNERWQQGKEQHQKTEWTKIVVWGEMAERAAEELRKGSRARVEGRLSTRKWEDKHKETRYSTEVVAEHVRDLGKPPEKARPAPKRERGPDPDEPQSDAFERDENGDQLPF